MKDKAKQIAAQAKQRWQAAPRKIKFLLAGCVLTVVVAAAVIALVMANRPYTELFTDLNQSDQAAILSYFSDNGITDYRVEGKSILVPEDQKASLMAQVLVAGYPSSSYDYGTYLDHVGSLTTEAERNQLVLYDLQDYMAAVICNMDGVENASVLLTPGEDHTYVLDSGAQVDATAAVQVTMEDGKTLNENQVRAIRSLVSHGLSGLNVENVEITDTYGNTYSADSDFTDVQDASQLKLELEEQYNNLIRTRVMQVLLPLYGADNVRVSVNTVVDLDRSYTDSTDYALEPWAQGKDDGIIGTQVWDDSIVRDDGQTAGGVAGTQSNADLNTYVENQVQPDGTESAVTASGQTDRLVDTTKQQVEHVAGYISDVMVSVTINQSAAGDASTADLYSHVGRAAGISAADQQEKISILVSPFYTEQSSILPTTGVSPWVLYAALGGVIVFLLVLLAVLLIRGRISKRKAQPQPAAAAAEIPQPVQQQADIMEMQTERSMELRQDIRKFSEENPEIAAQMVRNWLREGESK
ncbi:MAG: flagellar basal-body MS-ring/collar protein FliF [Dysosmobacter sp.]